MADVRLEGVSKVFGNTAVLHDIDLEITHRELVVFVGPSGCGKSTLLRMIAGLEDISAGTVKIDGRVMNDVAPVEREIAMVFQSYALYPHKTVRQNMSFGLRMAGVEKSEIRRKVEEAAGVLELTPLLDRKPAQLSGGQRQRVAIGRAIVRQPKIFLFDEPLSNLDAALRGQMRIEIARLHQSLDATMIYVTHDQVEAMTLADRIVVLNGGRIEQVGSPIELFERPRNLFVATFIGSPKMNLLAGRIASADGASIEVEAGGGRIRYGLSAPASHEPGVPVTLGLRPTDFAEGQGEVAFDVVARVVERLGSETQVVCELADGEPLTVVLDGRSRVKVGDPLTVSVAASRAHVFDASGAVIESPDRLKDAERDADVGIQRH